MKKTIFYSWQSDLPNRTNRGFIGEALTRAVKAILVDDSIEVEPVMDRDTQGVPGSPAIAETIFEKIASADVFVPDVSLITPPAAERPSPNPNVLLELGFAIKALGWSRIMMVMNSAFGDINGLPFDLRGRLVIMYAQPDVDGQKATEHGQLVQRMTRQLRGILENALMESTAQAALTLESAAIKVIDNQSPNRLASVRGFMEDFDRRLKAIEPAALIGGSPQYAVFATAIGEALPVVASFSRVSQHAAASNDMETLRELTRPLESIAERYDLRGSGTLYETDFAYWRFLGYQLIVTCVATMIRENRWEAIAEVLSNDLIFRDSSSSIRSAPFTYLYRYISFNHFIGAPKGLASIRAVLIKDLYSSPVGDVDHRSFMDADYLMFLRAVIPPERIGAAQRWIPESAIYIRTPPRYLFDAKRVGLARRIAAALRVDRPEIVRDRLLERHSYFGAAFPGADWPPNPFEDDMHVIHQFGSIE